MATVRHMEKISIESGHKHTETTCTFSIIQEQDGLYLQIDTYGSNQRKKRGSKSQSIRFAPEAIQEIKEILQTHF